ncbi:hypothetical protein A2U01_0103006, partial [Trifolium medium]|nr:hypothetical protein [Trifolium medium]
SKQPTLGERAAPPFHYNQRVAILNLLNTPPVKSGSGVSSGIKWFQPPPDCSCWNRTVVLPTKFSANHY